MIKISTEDGEVHSSIVMTITSADVPATVPRYDQKIIDAEVSRCRGDDDRVATTPVTEVVIEGIRIISRWQKAHEYDDMIWFVAKLSRDLRASVSEIFYDSKSCCVTVTTSGRAAEIEAVYKKRFGCDYNNC